MTASLEFQRDSMTPPKRERTESKLLATKVGSTFSDEEVFAEGTKWSPRTFFYKNATESTRAGRPLAASIYYHKNGRGIISVFSNFWGGRARVVQVDKAGNLSFAKSKVKSADSTRVQNAVDKGKRLADASEVLANTAFIEANRGELIVFGSKNATALTLARVRYPRIAPKCQTDPDAWSGSHMKGFTALQASYCASESMYTIKVFGMLAVTVPSTVCSCVALKDSHLFSQKPIPIPGLVHVAVMMTS